MIQVLILPIRAASDGGSDDILQSEQDVSSEEGGDEVDVDVDVDDMFSAPEFSTESELIEYIGSDRENQPQELFEKNKDNKEQLITYSFDNIPDGYELKSVRENGNFLTYDYTDSESNFKITFVWGFRTEGDEYLKNAVEMFELSPLPEHDGCYYSEAADDAGNHIYQIYWSEDGYCFQVNIPTKLLDSSERAAVFDFSITKNYNDIG